MIPTLSRRRISPTHPPSLAQPVKTSFIICCVRLHRSYSYDVSVIGVGAIGSAALYHSARAGLKVLGIEQFEIGHCFGSSHGHTRIFRVAHSDSETLCLLADRARALWEELEEDSHKTLLNKCGTLYLTSRIAEIQKNCDSLGFNYTLIDKKQLEETFPGFKVTSDQEEEERVYLFDPLGGFLESDSIIKTHVSLVKKMNGKVLEGEKVLKWQPDGSGVRIETNRNIYYTEKLILSTGAWILKDIPQLKNVCTVERQVVGFCDSKPKEMFVPSNFPTFISDHSSTVPYHYYGIPDHENQGKGLQLEFFLSEWTGLKIGRFNHLRQKVDADNVDRIVHQEDLDVLQTTLSLFFDPKQHTVKKTSVCLFTNTIDEGFIIDQHPRHPQVLISSACSGSGFKHSAAVGQILTEMAMENVSLASKNLLEPFQLLRPSLNLKQYFE